MKHLLNTSCHAIIIVVCGLLSHTPMRAQFDDMPQTKMPSSSMWITNKSNCECHMNGGAYVSNLTEGATPYWSPATNGYQITEVGAECACGMDGTGGYMTPQSEPRRVSPNGGLGEPGAATPIGDVPLEMILLFVGISVVLCGRKKKKEERRHRTK